MPEQRPEGRKQTVSPLAAADEVNREAGLRSRRQFLRLAGSAAAASMFWTACGGRSSEPASPTPELTVEVTATPKVVKPTPEATPKVVPSPEAPPRVVLVKPTPEAPLTREEFDVAVAQMEITKLLINEFVNSSLLKEGSSIGELPPSTDRKRYEDAALAWARYRGKNGYRFRTGLDGTLVYRITTQFDSAGRFIGATIGHVINSKVYPELGNMADGGVEGLQALAQYLFELPRGINWQQSSVSVQTETSGGIKSERLPAIEARFHSTQGSVRLTVGDKGVPIILEVGSAQTPR